MFNIIKRFVEARRIKREMKSGGHILLLELYLNEIFDRYGPIDSLLLGKLHDEGCSGHISSKNDCESNLANIKKNDEETYSDNIRGLIRHHIIEPVYSVMRDNYEISESPLPELFKEVEAQKDTNVPQCLIDHLFNTTDINELNAMFPVQHFKYIRQWCRQCKTWQEIDPTETLTLSFIAQTVDNNNNVFLKRILSKKCSLTMTRVIVSPFTWRIDFSGQWPKSILWGAGEHRVSGDKK